ncbi:hypothetical protein IWQ60_004706 [Tieghemiomyces parasiticus]|uniref:Thioredoxin domain-containing protein n=1 Tax=Tieghemiomyces parasiticus TaxID=78921 RepID=A0A9W8AAI2_9FUNG|nr:hypothetical protein IWQ60_004706 [Tieghemiomyces parasiticus]
MKLSTFSSLLLATVAATLPLATTRPQDSSDPEAPFRSAYSQVLDPATFDDSVLASTASPIVVLHYAQWCSISKRFAPIWVQATGDLQPDGLKFYQIDCQPDRNGEFSKYCSDHSVDGFPTVRKYRQGQAPVEYLGQSAYDEFVSWVME